MGNGCSSAGATPTVEPTITAAAPPPASAKGSPKAGRRYSSDPYEGGARPLANMDFSLRQLIRADDGSPCFRTEEHRQGTVYRVKLHPPPFELQTARGLQVAQLSRDTKNETPSLLALTGRSAPQDDIWGGKKPAVSYDVRIPASTLLDERDLDAGISYRGQLSIGPPKSNLSGKQRVSWLIK